MKRCGDNGSDHETVSSGEKRFRTFHHRTTRATNDFSFYRVHHQRPRNQAPFRLTCK